ncbi:efflux RND transporter periplasmic adaptor subunit [Teredinibacter haidensis]|uniref:efflux RND transporter periplasmic adaptor subunit n=1 Tax=Teredinibacter haidensis TaxID=2731755 RepID=UPI000948EA00|nr:efflux RND transporter periplasmic adaptor subunit [Teredinibacter haidensis]
MKKNISIIVIMLLVATIARPFIFVKSETLALQAEELQFRTLSRSIIASGNLNHEDKVNLSTEVIGKIKSLLVKEGDRIAEGQLLLIIDDEAYLSAVEQNEAAVRMQAIMVERSELRYENVLLQWKRYKLIFDKRLSDEQTLEQVAFQLSSSKLDIRAEKEQLAQMEAQLAQAKGNLAKTRIYSPIKGVVTSLSIKVGETAVSGTMNFSASSLMTIVNPSTLYAEINVDEADISNVSIGQHVEVTAIAYSEHPLNGVVYFIGETARTVNGHNGLSFSVKIRLEEKITLKLFSGMSVRAEIFPNGRVEKIAVPIQAVFSPLNKDNNNYVFVNNNGKARRVAVVLGTNDDEYQEITSVSKGELNVGDQVIVGPQRFMQSITDGKTISTALSSVSNVGR